MSSSIRVFMLLIGLAAAGAVCSQDNENSAPLAESEAIDETVAAGEQAVPEKADEPTAATSESSVETDPSDEPTSEDEAALAADEPQNEAESFPDGAVSGSTEAGGNADETTALDAFVPLGTEPMTLTLKVHPTYPPEQAALVYQPLINYLNSSLPHRIELQTSPDFPRFWMDIRRGNQPDLVLEDAHLIALRMERDGYTPLVKANQPATFSLLTSDVNPDIELADFIARPISTMPAPSLGYLVLASWYENPMQQPLILSNAASWRDAVEIVFSMEADAAIVTHDVAARYVNMGVVQTSREFPFATIAASARVPAEVQEQISEVLLSLHENADHYSALNELEIERFVPASVGEYQGLESWLELVYLGDR